MNKNQKILITSWILLIGTFVVAGIFQDNMIVSRSAFIPVVIYFLLNFKTMKNIGENAPTVKDVIYNSKILSIFGIIYLVFVICVSFYFLFSGKDLGLYISGFWSLMFVFLCPLIFPLIISQVTLYRLLGNEQL